MAPAAFASTRRPAPCNTRCCAPKAQRNQQSGAVQAAGLAAAILLAAAPAHAGIVTTEKPKTKNYVTQDAPKAEPEERELPNPADRLKRSLPSAPSLPALPALPALPSFGSGEGKGDNMPVGEAAGEGLDPKNLWPVGLLGTGAVLFALPKIDPGFDKMYQTAWVKDSGEKGFGIGTEDVLKNKGGYVAPYYERQEKEPKKSDVKSRSTSKIPQNIPGSRTSLRKKGQFP